MYQQGILAAKVCCILDCRSREVILPCYVRPLLDCCVKIGVQYKTDISITEQVQQRLLSWSGSWHTGWPGSIWGTWACSALRGKGFREGSYCCLQLPNRKRQTRKTQTPLESAQQQHERQQTQSGTRKFQPHGRTFLFFTTTEGLEHAAQRNYGISIPEDIQNLTGHKLEQPNLAGPDLHWALTRWLPEVPSNLD